MLMIAVIVFTFLLTGSLAFAIAEGLAMRHRRMRARLDRITGRFHREVLVPSSRERTSAISLLLERSAWGIRLQREILRAGLRLRLSEFVLLWLTCGLGFGLLGLALTHSFLLALVTAIAGFLVPPVCLNQARAARRKRFDAQIADALTLITSSLRSGYSFSRAAQMVADEMPPPVCEEFGWAMSEVALGVSIETALGQIVTRQGSYDMDLVTTAVSIQTQVGGNLAEILEAIAQTIRERVRVQGEISTLTAEGKLSAVVLLLLAPLLALFLLLRNPHYFQPMLESRIGILLLGGAVAGQMIGGLLIKRLVTLDV